MCVNCVGWCGTHSFNADSFRHVNACGWIVDSCKGGSVNLNCVSAVYSATFLMLIAAKPRRTMPTFMQLSETASKQELAQQSASTIRLSPISVVAAATRPQATCSCSVNSRVRVHRFSWDMAQTEVSCV